MDAMSLILQALEASMMPDVGTQAMILDDVHEDYDRFTSILAGRLADSAQAQQLLENYAAQPEVYEGVLVALLEEQGVDRDAEVIDAARSFMQMVGARPSRYNVQLDDEDLTL